MTAIWHPHLSDECYNALRPVFQKHVDKLKDQRPIQSEMLPKERGLYALSENGNYLYVGISRKLRARLSGHRRGVSGSVEPRARASSFAKKVALETMADHGNKIPRAKKERLADPAYQEARNAAVGRIRRMDVRFVTWDGARDDLLMLEMYAAHALKTPYN